MKRSIKFLSVLTALFVLMAAVGIPAAQAVDKDDNPPGPVGGAGTNWENPPGSAGGPGASPDKKKGKAYNPPGPKGGPGTGWNWKFWRRKKR